MIKKVMLILILILFFILCVVSVVEYPYLKFKNSLFFVPGISQEFEFKAPIFGTTEEFIDKYKPKLPKDVELKYSGIFMNVYFKPSYQHQGKSYPLGLLRELKVVSVEQIPYYIKNDIAILDDKECFPKSTIGVSIKNQNNVNADILSQLEFYKVIDKVNYPIVLNLPEVLDGVASKSCLFTMELNYHPNNVKIHLINNQNSSEMYLFQYIGTSLVEDYEGIPKPRSIGTNTLYFQNDILDVTSLFKLPKDKEYSKSLRGLFFLAEDKN